MRTTYALAWLLVGTVDIAQAMSGTSVLGLSAAPGWHVPTAPSGSVVLYEQFEGQEAVSIISQDFPAASDVLDTQAADDFSVPPGETWHIAGIDVPYSEAGSGPSAVGIHVFFIRNDVDNLPGVLVGGELSVPYTTGIDSGMQAMSIALSSPLTLPGGDYWIALQADVPSGRQWYWGGYRPQRGHAAVWRNILDGWGSGCTDWAAISDCFAVDVEPDLQFRLRGSRDVATRNGVYHSSPLEHVLAPTLVGTSLNLVSEALDPTGPLAGDWDLNFWSTGSDTLGFYGLDPWNARFLVDEAGHVAALRPGDAIGPASTFASVNGPLSAAAWLAGTDAYAGIRFDCNGRLTAFVDAGPCYGYVHLATGGPAGFPPTLIDYAYDGDGRAITIVAAGDVIFCSGFEGGDACDGASGEGIYTTRAQFVENLATGWFDNPFDGVGAGASAALEYDHGGTHYIVKTQPGAAGGLHNQPGVISTSAPGDMLSIHFSGAPVTAVGGNFWATDYSFAPTGTTIMLYLSDGTVHEFDTGGPDAFRGFVSRVPVTYLHIDALDGADSAWSTLDNLVIGVAR